MATVMFVDDEPLVLAALRRSLTGVVDGARLRFADSADAAVRALEEAPADILVSDLRMSPRDGVSLLSEVRDRWPGTVRLLMTGQVGDEGVRAVGVAHQVLAKPVAHEQLVATLSRLLNARGLAGQAEIASLVAGLSALPARSRLYAQVTALVLAEAPLQQIAEVVADDVALTARVLQLVNSAFFGLAREISGVATALSYLGIRTLQALVLSTELERSLAAMAPAGFPLETLNDYSTAVAARARQLALPGHEDAAFASALLHDVGLLVLAIERPDAVMDDLRAAGMQTQLSQIEFERWGHTHADVGNMLASLWGLAEPIPLAVSLHHHPPLLDRVADGGLDAVSAVQVALAAVDGRPFRC